jgi:multidrug resistance efflux pump
MRGKWLLAAAAVILLGAAAGAVSLLLRRSAPVEQPPQEVPSPSQQNEISLAGVVRAQSVVGVPAPIEGTLEEVLVAPGEEVHRDQLLAHIRNSAIERDIIAAQEAAKEAEQTVNRRESEFMAARLEASRAAADLSRVQAEFYKLEKAALRQEMLHREGATPRRTYEQAQEDFRAKEKELDTAREVAKTADERVSAAQQEIEQARAKMAEMNAELEAANTDLLASDVVSPVDGVVTAISAIAGTEVHPEKGDLLQIAVDLTRMEVAIEPPPPLLAMIRAGQPAQVHVAEAPGEAFPGTVKEVEGGSAIVEFANPSALVRPGLSAQVVVTIR